MSGHRGTLARLWLLGLLWLFPGCAESDLGISPPSPLSFEELKQRISRIRELPLEQEVSVESRSIEAIRALVENSFSAENDKENLQYKAQVYARLGLLPERTDFSKALLELRLALRPLFFDSRRNTIFVPKDSSRSAFTLSGFSSIADETAKQLLLTHALSYLLQEQHFRWGEKIRRASTEDSRLALRALREGDATLVVLAHLARDAKENKERISQGLRAVSRLPARIEKELSEFPELLRQKIAFQYVQGTKFVSWAYTLKGWQGVNSVFLRPPLSTQQLLHPEKYYAKREDPVRIVPWTLLRRFGGRKVLDETLGEFLIQSLLGRALSEGEAAQAAAGWAGDTLLAFRQEGAMGLGWVTAWDNREAASEFHAGFLRALERRHGVPLRPPQAGSDLLTAALPRGGLLLQIRDRFVFFLDGVAAPLSVAIAEELWSDLQTGTEAEPLDLAKRNRQALSVKR